MTLQHAAVRRCHAGTASCSRTHVRPRSSPISTLWWIPHGLGRGRVGIRSGSSLSFCPSVPLKECSRDKDSAIWCSCCQSAVCPLRLRAKPLRVLYEESDSLVPYLMQDFLLIHILAASAVFMYKMLKLFFWETFASVRTQREKEGPRLTPSGSFRRQFDVWHV